MRNFLLFALLLLPFAALAQSETCPRVWRGGDTLWTDPAPQIQWFRDGQPLPNENRSWLLPPPNEPARYSVEVGGGFSPAFRYEAGVGYALAGYVFDELHRPVAGASVQRGPFSATTDEKGRFVLSLVGPKPDAETPVVVTVEKAGYWRSASRQYASRFDTTETQVMLHAKRVTNRVDATKGGEMAYRGFTLQLPPNAVQTESGTPYNGTILLSVEGATPTEPDFGLRMPGGDFSAIDEGGNDVILYSYGYMSAEMTTESGQKLELRPEARATLRFQLPYTETNRPDSVPLWYFNSETAVWEQEGWSVRNGSIYEGQVSHFSSWNCDIPAERSTCRGRVIDCNDEPVKGGWVRVGQRHLVTDAEGNYRTVVPGGITFDAWAASDTLRGVTVPAQQERTLEDLTGADFNGVAVYNPQTQALSVYVSGNVPANLRLSLDGGASWTAEREFAGIAAAPSEVRLDGACTDKLRVLAMKRQEDCRKLTSEELSMEAAYFNLDDALSAERVYILAQGYRFTSDQWGLLLSLGCLHILSLDSIPSTSIPESIGTLTNLQALDLFNCQLTSLPESIGNLTNLRSLRSHALQLTSLPVSFGNLANLQTLLIIDSQLTSLPESFGNLTNLQTLSLYRNGELTSLPENFGNLTSLRDLELGFCGLTSLPESFSSLVNLQELGLSGNWLYSVPEVICNLANLQSLSLSDNLLTDLPPSIANLADTLLELRLKNNPIPVERRAAIQALLPNTRIIWE